MFIASIQKLKKKLAEDGLLNFEMGAVNSLNPELGIEEQADLLPYDSRWEFPREKLKLGSFLKRSLFKFLKLVPDKKKYLLNYLPT